MEEKFIEWENGLHKDEKDSGESKGSLLSIESRTRFFNEVLNTEPDVLIFPTILDLQIQKEYMPVCISDELSDYMLSNLHNVPQSEFRNKEISRSKMLRNLSSEQILKFLTLSVCVIDTLRQGFIFRSHGQFKKNWSRIFVWIDRSSVRDNSREELVFKNSLGWLLRNYTKRRPFELIEEIHTPDHPLIKNFCNNDGFDGEKLFRNIEFANSRSISGLRITDIITNTLYRVLNDLENSDGYLNFYEKIMKHSGLGPNSNLGFYFFPSKFQKVGQCDAKKYAVLQQILASRRDNLE